MGSISLRNLDDDVHRRVKSVASVRGISTEEAARQLLDEATQPIEKTSEVIAAYAKKMGVNFPKVERFSDGVDGPSLNDYS